MKRQGRKLSSGEIAVMAVLMLCMVLAVTAAGIRMASGRDNDENHQTVELEEIDGTSELASAQEETASKETTGESVVNEGTPDKFAEDSPEQPMDLIAAEDQVEVDLSAREDVEEVTETSGGAAAAAGLPAEESVPALDFQAADRLAWPVNGNIVLDYSMDSSVYFPTLKQYKYNPAVVISGEVGTAVAAAADGRVTGVHIDEETGTTVTMDLGNGYTAVYGQLKEVPVEEGSMVLRNDVIGYISEPTKYYSVEGSNVYFRVQKDGVSVDPLDYLE